MKVSFRVIAVVSFFSFLIVSACAKKEGEDCKTCKALNGNGTVAAERTVCTPQEESAFRNENPDKEVVCN